MIHDDKCEKHQMQSDDAAREQKVEMLKPLQHEEVNLPSITDCGCGSRGKDDKELEREE